MKMKAVIFFVTSAILIFKPITGKAQEQGTTQQEILSNISLETQISLDKIAENIFPRKEAKAIEAYKNLEQEVSKLKNKIGECDSCFTNSNEFIMSLEDSNATLKNLAEAPNQNPIYLEKKLELLAKDYEIKAMAFSPGLQNNIVTKIKVEVETTSGEGYEVFAKYSYDYDSKIKRFTFNNRTNNATKYFSPGYYVFWVEKDGESSDYKSVLLVDEDKDGIEKLIFD